MAERQGEVTQFRVLFVSSRLGEACPNFCVTTVAVQRTIGRVGFRVEFMKFGAARRCQREFIDIGIQPEATL